jgi:hypothetical protein
MLGYFTVPTGNQLLWIRIRTDPHSQVTVPGKEKNWGIRYRTNGRLKEGIGIRRNIRYGEIQNLNVLILFTYVAGERGHDELKLGGRAGAQPKPSEEELVLSRSLQRKREARAARREAAKAKSRKEGKKKKTVVMDSSSSEEMVMKKKKRRKAAPSTSSESSEEEKIKQRKSKKRRMEMESS